MLPIRDTIPSRRFPVVNTALIGLNVVAFLIQLQVGRGGMAAFFDSYALVPREFWSEGWLARWPEVFSSMFLHGSLGHLLSNMIALYIFGDNVEDRMGHGRYLVFYLLGGLVAAVAHAAVLAGSTTPTVGASGAIAAVLGAYFVMFPQSRVTTVVILFVFIQVVELPAVLYLGFWFISQVFPALLGTQAGVAWWAHIGGFVTGMLTIRLFARPQRWPR